MELLLEGGVFVLKIPRAEIERLLAVAAPTVARHINEEGLAIIRESEGLRLRAYKCPAGVWTIGYGHTNGVQPGDSCTIRQAEEWLKEDCEQAERDIAELVTVPLTDNQFSALVSWVFNIGSDIDADDIAEGLGDSTMLKRINAGDYSGAAIEMQKWNKAGGKTLPGLIARRQREAALWLS